MTAGQESLRTIAATIVIAASAALIASGCDDNPASPSPTPNLTIMLTDAPAPEVQAVNVFFTGVTVKRFGQSVQRLDLQLAGNPVNLLALDDDVVALASGVVEPGAYEFIQVDIDATRSSVMVDGTSHPLNVPSAEVKVVGTFTVDDDGTEITLDFDAAKSILPLGNGGWLLKPVIVKVDEGGSSQSARNRMGPFDSRVSP